MLISDGEIMLKVLFSGKHQSGLLGGGSDGGGGSVAGRTKVVVKHGNSNLDLFLRQCQPGC